MMQKTIQGFLALLLAFWCGVSAAAYAGDKWNDGIPIDDNPPATETCGGKCSIYKSDTKDTRTIEYVQIKLVEHGKKKSIKKTKVKVKDISKKKQVEKDIKKANEEIDKINKKQPADKQYPKWPDYDAVKKIVEDAKKYVEDLTKPDATFGPIQSNCFKALCDCIGDGKWKEFKPPNKPFQPPPVYIVYYVNDGKLRYEVKIKIQFSADKKDSIKVQEGTCQKKGESG